MTTSYICKRCKTISYADYCFKKKIRFTSDELSSDNVIFIGDELDDTVDDTQNESNFTPYEWQRTPSSISELQYIDSNREPLIVVELGRRKRQTLTLPLSFAGDEDIITNLNCTRLRIDDEAAAEFKSAILNYFDDNSYLLDKQLSKDFVSFIMHVYVNIRDGNNKLALLKLLAHNNIDTNNIETSHPVKYHEVESIEIANTDPFDDVKIVINKSDINASGSSAIYKHSPDDLKKAAVGNSTQLEAFSKNKFTVIHNKKSANIMNVMKRNHDVLDSLARNGVVCSPNTTTPLSMAVLMKQLRRFKGFDIVFIHPSYDLKITRSEYPSELIEPAYIVNEGEILAVAYRYITVNFFGYCSVYNEDMEEFNYLI